jgi:hypothetical protein
MQQPVLKFETKAGEPIVAGDTTIRLVHQAMTFHIPFKFGSWGFIWNRPVAITRRGADGQEQTTSIIDVTRVAQIAILAAGVVGAMVIAKMARR